MREYVIYTDESEKEGKYFSNFYGGALIRSTELQNVAQTLEGCKRSLNLFREVKWQKVTANYLDKYLKLMDAFFDFVADDKIKIRIMFTQNRIVPLGLSAEQRRIEYHLLYYQFLKHAFGLRFANQRPDPVHVRVNLDQLPENREENATFKSFILRLNYNSQFKDANVRFRADQIAEVSSRDHVLLQCLDVTLGAMAFRLNDKHKEKLPGQRRRGKRTVAKEALYRFLMTRIRLIYPNFNIGESTGLQGKLTNLWEHRYRHWKFTPKEFEIDNERAKPKK